jgi:formylglycine-generating enzyme required for sulfatase activity
MRCCVSIGPILTFSVWICAGCGSGLPKFGDLNQVTPKAESSENGSCSAVRPQTEPDLMGWDPGSRAKVDRLADQGLVAVRYSAKGCNVELEVLSHCIGSSMKYEYSPYWSMETKTAKDAGELYASLPIGAASLKGRLKGSRVLRTDYRLVGQLSIPPDAVVDASSLKGPECARATHVVSTLYVGGFALVDGEAQHLSAVADVFIAEAGGQKDSQRQRVFLEGDPEACERGKASGKLEPLCGVPLRVALLALEGVGNAAAASGSGRPGSGEMVRIPAGSFMMGSNDGTAAEKPPHRVSVSTFEMERTEVTVAAYQACVDAKKAGRMDGCDPPRSGDACNAADKANHPINCVSWDQAKAYCSWAGKRLPTEEEWEYAARGTEGRKYPWGSSPEPSNQLCWNGSLRQGTCPVGSFPSGATPLGVQDMAGNVSEWTSSGYSPNYQSERETEGRMVKRGGSWYAGNASWVRATNRDFTLSLFALDTIGFRCVR